MGVVRGDKREYLMGLCNDFDAKMWVLLVFCEINIFRGQDVKNFRQDYCGRWWVGRHVLKSTFGTVAGGGSSRGWWRGVSIWAKYRDLGWGGLESVG